MNEPSEAQVKEFWEWCGFKKEAVNTFVNGKWTPTPSAGYSWRYPNGREECYPPPIDLNNLFKYAVPKVKEHYKALSTPGYYCSPMPLFEDWIYEWLFYGKDPALALFWACYKALKEVLNDKT